MAKTYYSDISNHFLHYYFKNPEKHFESNAERLNWEACDIALNNCSQWEREVIEYLYTEQGSFVENAKSISIIRGTVLHRIWRLVNSIERNVAIARGLI